MNKYELDNLSRAVEERNRISSFLNDKSLISGNSNIDEIDVAYDYFLSISQDNLTE